jgi:hypothetical protein
VRNNISETKPEVREVSGLWGNLKRSEKVLLATLLVVLVWAGFAYQHEAEIPPKWTPPHASLSDLKSVLPREIRPAALAALSIARDQGWLPWTARVSANVSDHWIAGELKKCVSGGWRGWPGDEHPIAELDCVDEKPEYHDISIQFTGRRWTAQEKQNVKEQRWTCQRHAAPLLEEVTFSCQAVD